MKFQRLWNVLAVLSLAQIFFAFHHDISSGVSVDRLLSRENDGKNSNWHENHGGLNQAFEPGEQNGFENEFEHRGEQYRNAHGLIMAMVVLLLFPIGALAMRVLGRWWLHAIFQAMAILLLIAGFGVGVFLAKMGRKLFNNTHTILGTVVVLLFVIAQPLLGFLQHSFFRRNQSRGPAGHAHLWLGRILIVLGVVNGGLGLRLVDGGEGEGYWKHVYIGVAAAMAILYIFTIIGTAFLKRRRRKGKTLRG